VVSVNLTVPEKEEYIGSGFRLAKKPVPVRPQPYLHASRSKGSLFGITGMVVVAAILGLSVYFVLRYLL